MVRVFVFFLLLPLGLFGQKRGVVHSSVAADKDPAQTYAIYLPSGITANPPGLILFYDPGGRGRMPIEKYRALAEEFNIVIACSNNARNGAAHESINAGNVVLTDVLARFPIDRNFILTSGFSGGARTATQMAIDNRLFAGVIACGAAFPGPKAINKQKPVPFAEVIGRHDMNYQEAWSTNHHLVSEGVPCQLLFFSGGHEWPPERDYAAAIRWHLLRSKRLTNELEAKEYSGQLKQINTLVDSGRYFDALLLRSQLKQNFPGKAHTTKLEDPALAKKIAEGLRSFEKASELETQMQGRINYAYLAHIAHAAPDSAFHESLWQQMLSEFMKIESSDDLQRSDAGSRLIDYSWRMVAERTYMFMGERQYRQAAMSAKIWSVLRPNDPAAPLAAARAFAFQKRRGETISYLKLAKKRGVDPNELSDPLLAEYVRSLK